MKQCPVHWSDILNDKYDVQVLTSGQNGVISRMKLVNPSTKVFYGGICPWSPRLSESLVWYDVNIPSNSLLFAHNSCL